MSKLSLQMEVPIYGFDAPMNKSSLLSIILGYWQDGYIFVSEQAQEELLRKLNLPDTMVQFT